MEEILKQCKLTEEELKEFSRLAENIDHKLDHQRAYRTMMNPVRRDLLKYIGTNIRSLEEINQEFINDKDQIPYHLSMLEQLFYVMNTKTGWKATPRGIGFLANAVMEE